MAIDPKHAEAKADAKPDTAQDDAEANREHEPVKGWTFAEIGRRFNACDDLSEIPVEFWATLGMEKWVSVPVQMSRLITYAHAQNLLHLKGEAGDPEKAEKLADQMGTTVDNLYRTVEMAVAEYSQFERRIALLMADDDGRYLHASGEINLAPTPGFCAGDLDEEDDNVLPFDGDPGKDSETADGSDKEEGGEIDS